MGMKLPPGIHRSALKLAGVSDTQSADDFELARKELDPDRNKFGNIPVYHDGHYFQSTREGNRYLILKWELIQGRITELQLQVAFEFEINGVKIPETYVADFVYKKSGKTIVEDAKGVKTDLYKLKRSLMLACHGIEILET